MDLITDKELFELLDLSQSALTDVEAAVRSGDLTAAKSALVSHFRSRSYPVVLPLEDQEDQRGHAFAPSGIMDEADRICNHLFEFVGHPPQQLGREIAWNEDPVDYEQWAISFNRHFHWITLAKAYRGTGDEKYAQEFVDQLRSWIAAMPVEIGTRWVQAGWAPEGKMSLSLDAGIRMGQTWVPAFYAFLDSPSFTDDDLITMVKAFYDHAIYLMDPVHFRSLSNWGVMESNGLYHIGVYFPEFIASGEWRDTAMSRLHQEIDLQMYPDGAQIELASGYHHVSLRNFIMSYEAAKANDLSIPDDYLKSLENAYHYSLYVSLPDLRMPPVNDSGAYDIRQAMRNAHGYFPDRKDFEWVATNGESGAPLDAASSAFPYAGHFVMRSGWKPDDPCIFFDGGPYGYGHQHEDKLNIILYGYGETLIADPGNFQYDTTEWRRYMLSSWSHNTVIVDGQGQHQHGKPREEYIVDEPLPHTWIGEPEFDYVSAEYAEGYGPEEDTTVSHRRSILYVKPDLWIVTDILTPSDENHHAYESAFYFTSEDAEADGLCALSTRDDGPGCAIHGMGPAETSLRIAKGEREPNLRGWMPKGGDISCCHPSPTAVYSFGGTGTILATYVISTIPAGESSSVGSVTRISTSPDSASAIAGIIRKTDGAQVHFFQRAPGDQRFDVRDTETDAEAGAVIVNPSGHIEAIHLANGTGVWRDGDRLSVGDTAD